MSLLTSFLNLFKYEETDEGNFDIQTALNNNWDKIDVAVSTNSSDITTIQSIIASSVNYKGGYDAILNNPDLDISPSGVEIGDMYTVTATGTFFTADVEVGDMIIAEKDNAVNEADWTIVNKNLDSNLREDESKPLTIEVRTSDPVSPEVGRIWLRSDL